MKYAIQITGQTGEPFRLPGEFDRADAERSARFFNEIEGVTAEAVPVA